MTNMKPVTNKEIAQAFRDAIPHLSDGVTYGYPSKSSYICLALELGVAEEDGNYPAFLDAKEIITHRLGYDAERIVIEVDGLPLDIMDEWFNEFVIEGV